MSGVPPLARPGVDRAAHRRTDQRWLAEAWQRAWVFVVDTRGRALATQDAGAGPRLVSVAPHEAPDGERLFLGVDAEGTPYFAVVAALPEHPRALPVTLRDVGAALAARDAGLFVTAAALARWHAGHGYAPGTGAPTTVADGGWLRVDAAGNQLFPRTDPATIVLVHDGVAGPRGRCLLGNNAAWRTSEGGRRFFSLLAGFVEPGESAEAAVVREVREEVGLTVSRLRYEGSQAWPFPASLMLGFTGYADPAQPLRLDPAEIADARWFTRTQVAEILAGDSEENVQLSAAASIAHFLIRTWVTSVRPGAA